MTERMTQEPQANVLEEFGYDSKKQHLAKRADAILQKGDLEVLKEAISIFGTTLSAYSTGVSTPSEMSQFQGWMNGTESPPQDAVLRLAVSVDFAHQLRKQYESDNMARALFIGQKAQFNHLAMAQAVHSVQPDDIGSLHGAFEEIVKNDKFDIPYSAVGAYPGLEKYFDSSSENQIFKREKKGE